jgi:uncharacterized protein YigA (DUF484 family)
MSARSRIDELDMGLTSASELQEYIKRVRDLTRDLFMELEFAAEVLQQNLSTIPAVDSNGQQMGRIASRRRAKKVANCLRRAGESQKYCGGQAVKTWAMFVQSFAPEIEAERRKHPVKPGFKVAE